MTPEDAAKLLAEHVRFMSQKQRAIDAHADLLASFAKLESAFGPALSHARRVLADHAEGNVVKLRSTISLPGKRTT